MGEHGECPSCGNVIAEVPKTGAPWHFKVLLVGIVVYMVYRIYWLAEWLPKHL